MKLADSSFTFSQRMNFFSPYTVQLCVVLNEWFTRVGCPRRGSHVLPYCFLGPPDHSSICFGGFCLSLLLCPSISVNLSRGF